MVLEAIEHVKMRSKGRTYLKKKSNANISQSSKKEAKVAHKCHFCSFMTPSKEHYDKHMAEHSGGFQCDHCEKTILTRKDLNEHIFVEHKNTIICSFYMKGKCSRECGFKHPEEIRYCRYGSKCPYLESGRCRYFHKMLPMLKNVIKKSNPETSHGERT